MATQNEGTDEADLVRSAQAGDADAFAALVRHYQKPVYAVCWRYLRGSDAQDAAQETFVRAFVHKQKIDPGRPLLPWLITIARRLCLDRIRKHTPELTHDPEGPIAVDPAPAADELAASREQLAQLRKGLLALSEGPREAISLYHLEGLSYRDIATSLGVPIGTVMTWIHRGRAELRKYLSPGGSP